jgi:hypothetical protein
VTIESYLAGLERRLPRYRRRRVLSEVEEHLRDSADRHRDELAPEEAEAAAVADFGPVELVARRLRAEVAVGETRLASAAAFGAVLLFVFPLYVVPENTLPPAPWAEKPRDILVLQLLAVGLWILGGALAATGAALAWTRWSRFAAPVLELVLLTLAGSILVSAMLVVRGSVGDAGLASARRSVRRRLSSRLCPGGGLGAQPPLPHRARLRQGASPH